MKARVQKNNLVVELSLVESVLALKRRLEVPLGKVKLVKQGIPDRRLRLRLPGTWIPLLARLGTYYARENGSWIKEFWLVFSWTKPVTLELENFEYKRVILPRGDWVEDCIPPDILRS